MAMPSFQDATAMFLVATFAAPALAQPVPATSSTEIADSTKEVREQADAESVFEFSYAAPGSPVLPLIGVAGDQITRSETLRKFGIAMLQGLGGQATGQGIAIDFTPYWLLANQAMSLHDYRKKVGDFGRIAARTKIGLAASFGDAGNNRPSSFVASVSTSVLNSHDRLFDPIFDRCVDDGPLGKAFRSIGEQVAAELAAGKLSAETMNARSKELRAQYDRDKPGLLAESYAQCATRLAKAVAAKPSLDIGAGIRWRGTPGRFSQLEGSGTVLWGTFATGVVGGADADAQRAGPLARLRMRGLLHARYTIKDDVFNDVFALQGRRDSSLVVAGIESAPALDPRKVERLRWTLQAGWNRQSAVLPTDTDLNYGRYQAIISVRIMDGLWANGTLGHVAGRGVKSDSQALLSFTFTPPSKASKLTEYYNSRGQ
jgi:hypothetical protein